MDRIFLLLGLVFLGFSALMGFWGNEFGFWGGSVLAVQMVVIYKLERLQHERSNASAL